MRLPWTTKEIFASMQLLRWNLTVRTYSLTLCLNETTEANVKMGERALQNRAATASTPTQTLAVKIDSRMCRTSTNLRKRMKSLES